MMRLLLLLLAAVPFVAHAEQISRVNDLIVDGDRFQVSGQDPFLVLPVSHRSVQLRTDPTNVIIGLQIVGHSPSQDALGGELFFAAASEQNLTRQSRFDRYHRVRFKLPNTQFTRLQIPLPTPAVEFLRFDIDDCGDCILVLGNPSAGPMITPDITRIFKGLSEIPASGLVVPLDDWQGHDLELSTQATGLEFTATGGDPYLVSPNLDVKTNKLAGLYFELETAKNEPQWLDFQLFYATEKHQFVESTTSIFRIPPKHKELAIFIPVDFLRREFPPQEVLERLRLDLASHSVRSQSDQTPPTLRLTRFNLVSSEQADDYRRFVPSALVHMEQQKQSKRQLLSGIFKKLGRDRQFLVLYALLILTVTVGLAIKFWRLRNVRG